jgi:AcrR family transcriptional regulator
MPKTSAVSTTLKAVAPARAKTTSRTHDPQATAANILEVAAIEFAEKGLAGARIDDIAALTKTSKRMIYYYFQSKEGLYLAVLEDSYRRTREAESSLHLDDLEPLEALKKLVEFTVDYKLENPNFTRLVMNENIHRGAYLAQSQHIQNLNNPAIEQLESIYKRGLAQGIFRAGLDSVELHRAISALSIFNVSNQYTFSVIFKRSFQSPDAVAAMRANAVDLMTRYMSV